MEEVEVVVAPSVADIGLRLLIETGLVDDLQEADRERVAEMFRAMLSEHARVCAAEGRPVCG